MIGTTIKHYKILERIGAGGMGVVYKAEDTRLGRTVAMKFLPPYALDSPEDRIRFVNEAQSAAALDHPNICTIHEIGESGEHQFIVMSYVEGPSLKDRLKDGPIEPAEAINIAGQIATGLTKAHEKGIIHRDIKPANILLSKDGLVKICDFGLAKSSISKKVTRTGSTIGTAAYMSPEQARSETVDQRTDVWSLGVILYEMLAGKPPFVADHEAVVIYAILNDECPPLEEKRPGLPSALYRIVSKSLAAKATERYSSMEEMRRELKAVAPQLKGSETISGTFKAIPSTPVGRPISSNTPNALATAEVSEPLPAEPKRKSSTVLYSTVGAVTLAAALLVWWFNRAPSVDVADDGSLSGPAPTIAPPTAAGDAEALAKLSLPAGEKLPVIGVLYMENLSGDKAEDYFSAGMTEDIIYELANIKKLRVLSRYDVAPLRGQALSVADMGKKLKADYLLEGSVRKDKKQLRLTAHLHRVSDSELLWSLKYDRPAEDIFAVQSEIADSVARALAVTLAPEEKRALASAPTRNPEAYDHYLRGRHAFERRSQEDNEQAEKAFRRAITLDANFASAYTGLARTLLQRPDWGWDANPKLLTEAESHLDKAASGDSTSFEYFYARGLLLQLRNDDQGAIRWARRGVQAFPENPDAHYRYGLVLANSAQLEEASRELRRTVELKPDHTHAFRWLGHIADWSGKPSDAIKHHRKALALEPDAVGVLSDFGAFRIRRGEFAAADSLLNRAIALRPKTYDLKGVAGQSALYQGRLAQAVDLLSEASSKAPDWNHLRHLGLAYKIEGKKSQAEKSWRESLKLLAARLEQFSDDPDALYRQLYIQCLLGDVRDPEPRFRELAKNTKKTPDPTVRYYWTAAIDAHFGNIDRAIENIDRILKMNVLAPAYIGADPAFANLKNDTRFQKLVGSAPSS